MINCYYLLLFFPFPVTCWVGYLFHNCYISLLATLIADGVPKEGLRIQDVLVRIGVLMLVSEKVNCGEVTWQYSVTFPCYSLEFDMFNTILRLFILYKKINILSLSL